MRFHHQATLHLTRQLAMRSAGCVAVRLPRLAQLSDQRMAQCEDQKDVVLGGWLPIIGQEVRDVPSAFR